MSVLVSYLKGTRLILIISNGPRNGGKEGGGGEEEYLMTNLQWACFL